MSINKGGRPTIELNYEELAEMCKIQCTGEEISAIFGIDYDTLDNRLKADGHGGFSDYKQKKSAGGKMSLRRRQFKAAVEDGSVPMMIWMGKQLLGQSDKQETKPEVSMTDMTEEQLDMKLKALINGAGES
mgnify:CR=1 FL=1